MTEKKKFERLFELYSSLVVEGFIPKNKIMNSNNMSTRTAQRDIEDIQKYLKIDLISDNDKYYVKKEDLKKLRRGVNLNNKDLKENLDKLFSVFIKKISSNLSLIPHSTISKLLPQNVDNEYYDVIIIANNDINNISMDNDILDKLICYVKDLDDISFDYYLQSGDIVYRVNAVAYLIYYFQGIWYLVANDNKHNKIKTYIITNISNIQLHKQLKFRSQKEKEEHDNEYNRRLKKREELINLIESKRSIYWSDDKLIKTVINFHSDVAHFFKNRYYGFNQKVKKELSDGSIEVSFNFSSFTELRIFLSPWLGYFTIISPEEFRIEFIDYLNNALNIMNKK
ncbi:WYL domain-containing protein [Brachyspira alvinipulli]|uniref:helix-turn-helix transcriptional regulator n=1 Tax=Brachyspira alvinipulli TaxID=84379 RepID=UPI0026060DEA|nr:WYL domain-containing protein [uncultured Brachyspira sp.]